MYSLTLAMQGPVIAKFIALKRLDLRDNALDTLPMELAQLANLEVPANIVIF